LKNKYYYIPTNAYSVLELVSRGTFGADQSLDLSIEEIHLEVTTFLASFMAVYFLADAEIIFEMIVFRTL
jgi:hypothetical protein